MRKTSLTGVLGIVGSPRPGGNTDTLVDAVLRGARRRALGPRRVIAADVFDTGAVRDHPDVLTQPFARVEPR
jgi:hypothetical protein